MTNKLKFLFIIFRPIGYLYSLVMVLRARLYKTGFFTSSRLSVPVISVGNLTMGGSGKTPLVIYLTGLCRENGINPAVVSRGYRGKASEPVNVISDGETIFLSAEDAGDEPRMIAELAHGTVVLTGKKRVKPCEHAIKAYGSNAIILDDGFQHLALHRDIDIVLFNASELFSHFHVVPGGMLREPFKALQRASCVCITGGRLGKAEHVNTFTSLVVEHFPEMPIFHLENKVTGYIDAAGLKYALDHIGSPVLAFCGIASPERFRKSLEDLSVDIIKFHSYSDHMDYTSEVLHSLSTQAQEKGAHFLLTTEKDLVKIRDLECHLPILALSIQVDSHPEFDSFIRGCLKSSYPVID